MNFRVELDTYRGPLDLLLYLVRKHEVDIVDLPIATVTEQYLDYIAVLEKIDVNAVGEFLDMASTLIEIKSRMVLPRVDETEEPLEDPREELVERLLEYKKYKDAATILEDQSRQWQMRYARQANDLPERTVDPAEQPIKEVELWDLVSSLGRILREHEQVRAANIVYDDTPIHVYMQRIHERLAEVGRVAFSEMFRAEMHKSAMIGVFLATLELVRHRAVQVEQSDLHGEIWLRPDEEFDSNLDTSDIADLTDYGGKPK
jgi:segregation and condensation protein A